MAVLRPLICFTVLRLVENQNLRSLFQIFVFISKFSLKKCWDSDWQYRLHFVSSLTFLIYLPFSFSKIVIYIPCSYLAIPNFYSKFNGCLILSNFCLVQDSATTIFSALWLGWESAPSLSKRENGTKSGQGRALPGRVNARAHTRSLNKGLRAKCPPNRLESTNRNCF